MTGKVRQAPSISYPTDQYRTNFSIPTTLNPKTLKITHNGSQIRFFIDNEEMPNPSDPQYTGGLTPFQGSEAYVSWTNNFYVIVSAAFKSDGDSITASAFDDCLIRSSVGTNSSSLSEIYPKGVINSTAINFTNYILPKFDSTNNAGVDEITVTLPSGYTVPSVTGVQSDYDNDGILNTLTVGGGAGQYTVSTSGQTATIILGTRITNNTSNKKIIVAFSATTPSTTSYFGDDFITTIEGKHHGTSLLNATTGPTRLISGDVDATVSSDSILVKVYDSPQIEVAIDPYSIGLDVVNTTFNYNIRNASSVGNMGVTKIRIDIPADFTLQGVDSLLLTSVEEETAITTTTSNITVDYGAVGKTVPAGGGADVISMNMSDSLIAAGGPYAFTSVVDDEVSPVGWISTTVQSGQTNAVMITEVQASGSAYIKPNKIFTSVSNTAFSYYIVNNGSGANNITWAIIKIPTGFTVTNNTHVSSQLLGTSGPANITVTGTNTIILDYGAASKPLVPGALDIITINAHDSITDPTYGRKWTSIINNGTSFYPATTDAGVSLDIIFSPFGSCSGKVYPLDVISSITIYQNDTVIANTTTDGVTGYYQAFDLNPGNYDLYIIGPGYAGARYIKDFTVQSNVNTGLADIYMNQNALDSESTVKQERKYIDDPLTKLEFPAGALSKDAFVTIAPVTLSNSQITNISDNKAIKPPTTTASFDAFSISMQDSGMNNLESLVLNGDVTLTIHYDQIEIAAKGWNEENLALYFWDGVRWIKIGGTVNASSDLITANIRHLRGIYAVFEATDVSGVIRDVTVSPNPFTPLGSSQNTASLSFTLDQAYDTVEVKIFSLRGRMVRNYTVSGTAQSGSVPWDGKDKDGYMVKSGIYIFQITAGGTTYSGKILMIK